MTQGRSSHPLIRRSVPAPAATHQHPEPQNWPWCCVNTVWMCRNGQSCWLKGAEKECDVPVKARPVYLPFLPWLVAVHTRAGLTSLKDLIWSFVDTPDTKIMDQRPSSLTQNSPGRSPTTGLLLDSWLDWTVWSLFWPAGDSKLPLIVTEWRYKEIMDGGNV